MHGRERGYCIVNLVVLASSSCIIKFITLATPTCEERNANTRAHSIHVFVQFICPHDYMIYPGIDTIYIIYYIFSQKKKKKLYILFV